MKSLSTIASLLAIALVAISGYVHGAWTGRWQSAEVLAHAAEAIKHVPKTIGDWDCVRENQLTQEELDLASVAGYVSRHYRNRRTNEAVQFVLMCGPAGPIAVHPPTACYTGLGYQQVGETAPYHGVPQDGTAAVDDAFQTARFESPRRGDTIQPHIYWAWSTDGRWQTPESPRLAFVGSPVLFKAYVAFETDAGVKLNSQSPAAAFLDVALPVLRERVFGVAPSAETAAQNNPTTHSIQSTP